MKNIEKENYTMRKINEKCNLCESCKEAYYRSLKDKETGAEIKGFECPYSDTHVYDITECNHYSKPNAFQKFLQNKLAVTFTSLILLAIIICITMIVM